MTETKTYNGWTNYETWSVALVIDNEQGLYNRRVEMARDHWNAAEFERESYFTRSEKARYEFADTLKEWVTDETQGRVLGYDDGREERRALMEQEPPSPDDFSMLAQQLLGGALSEVAWSEISDNWLSEVEGYERMK